MPNKKLDKQTDIHHIKLHVDVKCDVKENSYLQKIFMNMNFSLIKYYH